MPARSRSAFTMIELLLVVAIILIASAIAMPSFIRSYRGAKLRTSARTVVMIHRHARSMAVLGQQHIALLFDKKKGEIEVVSIQSASQPDARSLFMDERAQRATALPSDAPPAAEPAAAASVSSKLIRPLEAEVQISAFTSEKSVQEHDGIHWVNYSPNGMSDKYALTLTDAHGKSAEIKVDPLSGRVSVEYP